MGQQPPIGLQTTFLLSERRGADMAGSPRDDKPPAGRRQEDKGSSAVFFQGPESHGLWRKIIICCWLWGRELCGGGWGRWPSGGLWKEVGQQDASSREGWNSRVA